MFWACPGNKAVLDIAAAAERIRKLADTLEIEIDPYARVGDLTVGQQQRVEIIKALLSGRARADSGRTDGGPYPRRSGRALYDAPQARQKRAWTIIMISPQAQENHGYLHACTILRQGRLVRCVNLDEVTDNNELATLMVDKELIRTFGQTPLPAGEVVLRVTDLCYTEENRVRALEKVSFALHEGEILGICGVDGNGSPS